MWKVRLVQSLLSVGLFSIPFLLHAADSVSSELHHVKPEACKQCHEEIYYQWSGSMHAKSSALKDPIHGAFYKNVMGDPKKEGVMKKGKYPVCLK
jgi:hypothetical protein